MPSRSTPAEPLNDWEQWQVPFTQTPKLIKALSGGRTNHSYLIEVDDQRWVLRINSKDSLRLGINRQHEATILQHASNAGIAPTVLYCSPENGVLISEYVEGRHWHSSELNAEDRQHSLVELLQACHSLEIDIPEFNYSQHLQNYWDQLQSSNLSITDKLHQDHEAIMQWVNDFSIDRKICHHDPSPQNIMVCKDKLYLLDWEYAGLGWPEFDFAALLVEWGSPGNIEAVKNHTAANLQQLRSLYSHLCKLWTLLSSIQGLK